MARQKVAKRKPAKSVGRPPAKFNQKTADKFCGFLAIGESMRTVCARPGMPARTTIFKWLRENEEFTNQYARAKEEAADALVEEILDIADDGTNDWMEKFGKKGDSLGWVVNGEAVQRSRVRIDARKFLAMKLKPKKYGDKLEVKSESNINGSVTHKLAELSDEELRKIAASYAKGSDESSDDTE